TACVLMTFGLRCSGPACRPHPASLPVRIPTVESLPSASFSFASRLRLAVRLRLPSSAPLGSFHPIRFCPCWAHPAAGCQPARRLERQPHGFRYNRLQAGCSLAVSSVPTPEMMEAVYGELRRLAGMYLRRQRQDHTLQPTALVHEAYLRLARWDGAPW